MISKALKNSIDIHHIVFTVVDILETESSTPKYSARQIAPMALKSFTR